MPLTYENRLKAYETVNLDLVLLKKGRWRRKLRWAYQKATELGAERDDEQAIETRKHAHRYLRDRAFAIVEQCLRAAGVVSIAIEPDRIIMRTADGTEADGKNLSSPVGQLRWQAKLMEHWKFP